MAEELEGREERERVEEGSKLRQTIGVHATLV